MKQSNLIDEKLIDSIICVAYGDASLAEKIRVYFISLRNPRVKELLEEYKTTAGAVHYYRNMECPREVILSAKNKIRSEETAGREKTKYAGFAFARPLLTTASALILIAIISFFVLRKPPVKQQYSKAEVLKAEQQVKESLAIVGRVFRSTENTLTQDVLEKQVTPPIKKSINIINNLLNGG